VHASIARPPRSCHLAAPARRFFFVQGTQTFAAMCTIWALFQCERLRQTLEIAWKGALSLFVILLLDVVMSAALEDHLRASGDVGSTPPCTCVT